MESSLWCRLQHQLRPETDAQQFLATTHPLVFYPQTTSFQPQKLASWYISWHSDIARTGTNPPRCDALLLGLEKLPAGWLGVRAVHVQPHTYTRYICDECGAKAMRHKNSFQL